MSTGSLFLLAWRVVPRLPGSLVRGLFDIGALVAHAARLGGVRRLERNLGRVLGETDPRRLRRLSRAGMRSYMRYYAEVFQLPGLDRAQVVARVRTVHLERVLDPLGQGRSVVGALTHSGNWDLAGAWFALEHGSVVTVAETLEPAELFREFLAFREGLGMTIVPFVRGTGVFRRLLTASRSHAALVPLLADRDLTRDGVEVDVAGHGMRVAPGPAALALAAGADLLPIHVGYERLTGARRRRAGSPWGIVITFGEAVPVPEGPRADAVAAMTQGWVDAQMTHIRAQPQDWHMLQKVFTDDLDGDRLARAQGGALT